MTTIKLSSKEWKILKENLSEKLGFKTDDSLNSKVKRICERAKELNSSTPISSSNLYAAWKKESHTFTDNFINALVLILGYSDWEHYQNRKPLIIYNPIDIDVSTLEDNLEFTLGWKDKYCILKYRGELEFEVLKSVNMKSEVGRIFWTTGFSVATSDGFEGPTIILDDGEGNLDGDGYFKNQANEGAYFDNDYFYL